MGSGDTPRVVISTPGSGDSPHVGSGDSPHVVKTKTGRFRTLRAFGYEDIKTRLS